MVRAMHRLTALLLAVIVSVATFAVAWAAASSVGTATPAAAEAHAAHAEAGHVAEPAGAPAGLAVHHGHPDGISTEDCAAMAIGCAGLLAHAAPEAAPAAPPAKGLRARHRDVLGHGTSPGRLDRPPRR